ncbi:hypothetical protein B5O65_000666 [Salmonella enterica subsp. enterica serovar Baildon]|nr:hypothetical protein [Salmonella enterica subsp. enterica serovar Baildon]
MDKLLERFLHYVSLDTQSKSGVRQVPSTEGQWKLLRLLKQQLEEMGLVNITLSEKGTLMATLPANVEGDIPAIGFISHVDTSPDFSGKNVNPQIVENYRGGDIALGIGDEVLSPVMFPVLHQLLGQTLITTDGKTLLGADDKAGVAEIMTALAVLKGNPIPHGELVYTLNRMRDAYSDALEERDVECDSARKAYYLAKIDATERQWLSVILRDKTWDNRERVASFLQQKADIAYNAGHISEAINALSQALKIEQTLYGAEFGEMTVDSNNLAGFYAQGHHYKEAKDLYLKLIAYYQSRLTPMATVISRLRFYLPENIDLDSTSLYLPLLAEYKRRQSDVSMVLYGISLLYQSNQELEQAKDFAERAFTLDAVAYPAKMQYERLQQLANIAEGLGDNVLARRYRQMSFRHRMAHSIYPGDPQYNDVAKPGGDRCG